MANSKPKLSPSSKPNRQPYEPISHTWEIPASLWEAKHLSMAADMPQLTALIDSIIVVSGADPHLWRNLNERIAETIPVSVAGGD